MCHFDKLTHTKCAKFQDKKNDTLYFTVYSYSTVLQNVIDDSNSIIIASWKSIEYIQILC